MQAVESPLLPILREARNLLAQPNNNFSYSKWGSADEALWEMDEFMAHVDDGLPLDHFKLKNLFAPTGSIQEVAVSSGWVRRFNDVASRFDEVIDHA